MSSSYRAKKRYFTARLILIDSAIFTFIVLTIEHFRPGC